ncbi:MAG: hypothetical protein NT029_16125 [Armatimonadetes bacterium]|nr:hypothetical protein [Armatimonadota bacterium]
MGDGGPVSAPPTPLPGLDGGITVVTGPRGSGKSSLCLRWAEEARSAGLAVAGLVTIGVWAGGEKTGLQALDLRTGIRRGLAHIAAGGDVDTTLGRWVFDHDALRWGAGLLHAACPTDLLIVDELGPLELCHASGWHGALEVLQAGAYGAAAVTVRPSLLERFGDVAAVRHVVILGCREP